MEVDESDALEYFIRCPDKIHNCCGYSIEHIIKEVKCATSTPLILKLSVTNRIDFLLNSSIDECIEAISINSVPWSVVYPYKKSPLEKYGGGTLSGKIAQKYTRHFIKQLISMTDIPIIGCSVWDYDDIQKLYDMGCSAIAFGSIFLRYPWRPTQFVKKRTDTNTGSIK